MTKECGATRDHKSRRNSKLENATGELGWFRGPVSCFQRHDKGVETMRERDSEAALLIVSRPDLR